ncbi:MAG TPA: hypothetical protein VLM11_13000 [Streptosporangiaceae bacterium]|nr:hypothetical protein [Streptosporangiaceae bacterium]
MARSIICPASSGFSTRLALPECCRCTPQPLPALIGAARQAGLPLWCDDNVLRQRARAAGVDAFSIADLLTVLIPDQPDPSDAADSYWEPAWTALASQYVADLPLTAASIIAIAGDWTPGPADTALARPGWWQYLAGSWAEQWLATATVAAAAPGTLTDVTLAALTGALQAVPTSRSAQRYQQIAAIALAACHYAAVQPPPTTLPAMAGHVGRSVMAKPEHVLRELIRALQRRPDIPDPVGAAVNLLPGVPLS